MPRMFISYRRDDSASQAGRLYDRLEGHFGQGQVFMDVDAIKPGLNFVEVVQQAVTGTLGGLCKSCHPAKLSLQFPCPRFAM